MKKIKFDGYDAFEWEPGEESIRAEFESAIADTATMDILAQSLVRAMQQSTARRQAMWADVAAKIEKETGYDLGRQLLDYSTFKRIFVVLPNPNEKKIIKPAKPGDIPPPAPGLTH